MVSAGNELRAGAPWSFRLFAASGLTPAWTAFLFAVLTITVFVAGEFASGRPGRLAAGEDPGSVGCTWILGDYRIVPMAMILIGYVIAARIYLARWTRETLETLRPSLPPEASAAAGGPLPAPSFAALSAGLGGIALTLIGAFDISDRQVEMTGAYWIWPHIWEWASFLPFGWISGRFLWDVADYSIRVSRLAPSLEGVDLLETDWVRPFVHQGLRSALLVIVFIAILGVHFVDAGTGPVTGAMLVGLLGVGAGVSVLPGVGARARIRSEKYSALHEVRGAIRDLSQRVLADDHAAVVARGKLGDLVAMESRLQAVTEWPMAFSSVGRLLVYSLVGLTSWLGAAAVEMLLNGVLS